MTVHCLQTVSALREEQQHDTNQASGTLQAENKKLQQELGALQPECQHLRQENMAVRQKVADMSWDQNGFEGNNTKVKDLTDFPSFTLLVSILNYLTPHLKTKLCSIHFSKCCLCAWGWSVTLICSSWPMCLVFQDQQSLECLTMSSLLWGCYSTSCLPRLWTAAADYACLLSSVFQEKRMHNWKGSRSQGSCTNIFQLQITQHNEIPYWHNTIGNYITYFKRLGRES